MKVPYNYLPQEFGDTKNIFSDWARLIESSEYTLGPFVEEFELKFAELVGSKHAISTNNGTDALILALRSLKLERGFEAIVPANTFYATAGAVVAAGGMPVFCDVDSRYQLDLVSAESVITGKTRVILPVHWAGASPNMNEVIAFAEAFSLYVVEDACMGIGGRVNDNHPGTFGNLGAFSMHPLKSLNVIGDGGVCVTNDSDLADWMRKYRNHGMVDRDHIDMYRVNMRIQPLQAVVAMDRMPKLAEVLDIRRRNASLYDQGLSSIDGINTPPREPWNSETHSLYMVLAEHRDRLLDFLIDKEIDAKIHYPKPLHLQHAQSGFGKAGQNLSIPNAEEQAKKLLTIPVHQFLNNEQIIYVNECIREFYEGV